MTVSPRTADSSHLPALTGVRGVASLCVVLLHLSVVISTLLPESAARLFRMLASPGFLGVDVFFVLSGFVIAYNYATAFHHRITGSEYRRFLVHRLARIYPVHLVLLMALVVAVRLVGVRVSPTMDAERWSTQQLIESLLLLHAWTGHSAAWNAVSWSLSCEWFVYLVFPLGTLLASRRAADVSTRALWLIVIALLSTPSIYTTLYPNLPGRLLLHVALLFSAGCLLQVLYRRGATGGVLAGSPGVLLVLMLTCAGYCIHQHWSAYLAIPLLAPVMQGLAFGRGTSGRWLATPFMGYLGRLSFSLYMTHYLWLWVMQHFVPLDQWGTSPLGVRIVLALGSAVPMLPIAAITYHIIEQPTRRWVLARCGVQAAIAHA